MKADTVKTIIANFQQMDLVVERLLLAPVQGAALINALAACKNSVQAALNEAEAQAQAKRIEAIDQPERPAPAPAAKA